MWHTKPISFSDYYVYRIATATYNKTQLSLQADILCPCDSRMECGHGLHYQTICHILAHVCALLVDPAGAAAALSFLSASNPILELFTTGGASVREVRRSPFHFTHTIYDRVGGAMHSQQAVSTINHSRHP